MKDLINYIDSFLTAEVNAISASDLPDLDNFNTKLELMNEFLVEPLKNTFGMIPMTELSTADYYERVKDYPAPTKRHLFRIDEYKTPTNEQLFFCYCSKRTPDDWKRYHNILLIKKVDNKYKITSKFTFSDDENDSTKRFYFSGGEKEFMQIVNGKYLLNKNALGELVKVNRLLEPSNDEESMRIYKQDKI